MRRETDLIRVGVWCVAAALAGGCAASEPGAQAPDAEQVAAPSEPESESPSSASNDLDVNMSFGEGEEEEAAEEEAGARGYTPPPTRAYSPSNKVTEADKPTK